MSNSDPPATYLAGVPEWDVTVAIGREGPDGHSEGTEIPYRIPAVDAATAIDIAGELVHTIVRALPGPPAGSPFGPWQVDGDPIAVKAVGPDRDTLGIAALHVQQSLRAVLARTGPVAITAAEFTDAATTGIVRFDARDGLTWLGLPAHFDGILATVAANHAEVAP